MIYPPDLTSLFLLKNLRNLSLHYIKFHSAAIFQFIPQTITSLDFTGSTFRVDDPFQFMEFDSKAPLLSLSLNWTIFQDTNFNRLPKTLTELNLFHCHKVSNEGMKNLPPHLIKLNIRGTSVVQSAASYFPSSLKMLSWDYDILLPGVTLESHFADAGSPVLLRNESQYQAHKRLLECGNMDWNTHSSYEAYWSDLLSGCSWESAVSVFNINSQALSIAVSNPLRLRRQPNSSSCASFLVDFGWVFITSESTNT